MRPSTFSLSFYKPWSLQWSSFAMPTVFVFRFRLTSERLVCEFIPDFEELAFNLACCPDDSCVSASDASIELHDTVHLKDMLDNEHCCPAVMSDFGLSARAVRA